jgi:uncharacterized membrane protein
MNLSKFARLVALPLIALTMSVSPAAAHKKHHAAKAAPVATTTNQVTPGNVIAQPGASLPNEDHMAGMMKEMDEDRSNMSTGERLLDWLGRFHTVIIHFPLAFFPAALFTAVVGRRRPGFAKPVQFLIVAGGIIAPIAAILGWLDAIDADPSSLLTVHRWLGTGIGFFAFGLAMWAWKRPESDRSAGMMVGLAVLTAALIVQGWYGGALVHGVDHMNW